MRNVCQVYQENVYREGKKFYSFKKVLRELQAEDAETYKDRVVSSTAFFHDVGRVFHVFPWFFMRFACVSLHFPWRFHGFSMLLVSFPSLEGRTRP